jgi:hypothetical protein
MDELLQSGRNLDEPIHVITISCLIIFASFVVFMSLGWLQLMHDRGQARERGLFAQSLYLKWRLSG